MACRLKPRKCNMKIPPDDLKVIDDLIDIYEAALPANPASAKNIKRERAYTRTLTDYFQRLEQAFPYDKVTDIYYRHVKEGRGWFAKLFEADPVSDTGSLFDPILKTFRAGLLVNITGQHVAIYMAAAAETTSWGRTKAGIPITYEGPPIQQAIQYAQKHCAQLVTRMDKESKDLIAQTVADAVENKRGIGGLARDLRHQFEDMSRNRSITIARTETCDASEQGFMDTAKGMGVTGKEWITHDPCEICAQNEDIILPLDGVFPSGDERPPAHPNCRCALAPVMLKEEV